MTIEHSIVVGLGDIKAIIFKCKQCNTRVTMSPDEIQIPQKCPKHNCGAVWTVGNPVGIVSGYDSSTSAYYNLVTAIESLRKKIREAIQEKKNTLAFSILFEFEESQTDSERCNRERKVEN